MYDANTTAARIASARRELGFTQEELAQQLGVTAQAISKWERGLSLPDISLLLALSRILHSSLEQLPDDETAPSVPIKQMSDYDHIMESLAPLRYDHLLLHIGIGIAKQCAPEEMAHIKAIRALILTDTGVLLPAIRIMDDDSLADGACQLTSYGEAIWEHTYAKPADTSFKDIASEVENAIRKNLPLFVNRHMILLLVENLRNHLPYCVEGVVPERISLTELTRHCRSLVAEGKSIRNLPGILSDLEDRLDTAI